MTFHLSLEERPHYVYLYWRDDECLYVGMTSNPASRMSQHKGSAHDRDATHIDVWYVGDDRRECERIETETIRALDPPHNTYQSPRAEAFRAAWAEYSAWCEAYRRAWFDASCEWAYDQDTADRVHAAVGYPSFDIAAALEANRQSLTRAAEAAWATPQAS